MPDILLVDERVKKVLEGEIELKADCPKYHAQQAQSPALESGHGITLTFPWLTDNRHRRWLVTQAKDEMVMLWTLEDNQEIMSWQDFRKKIAFEPTELQALIEQLPIDLLPGVLNLSARRLAACIKGEQK